MGMLMSPGPALSGLAEDEGRTSCADAVLVGILPGGLRRMSQAIQLSRLLGGGAKNSNSQASWIITQ
jgi:hypothetical protein